MNKNTKNNNNEIAILRYVKNAEDSADSLKKPLKPSEGIRKVILRNGQSPGDILMLTAAVRDLKLSHPDKSAVLPRWA